MKNSVAFCILPTSCTPHLCLVPKHFVIPKGSSHPPAVTPHCHCPWSRKWQPTPVFLPGKLHGQESLAGYSPWGRREADTKEREHAGNTSLLSVCTVLLVLHISGNWKQTIHDLFVWHFSPSIMFLRFIHVAVCTRASFLIVDEQVSVVWMWHNQFVQ